MSKLMTFSAIMMFYIILSYLLFPAAFYYGIQKSYESAGNGYILGSLISIGLWQFFGKNVVEAAE
uniref:Uncharacterized protein n=1 Tax=viral metagenome TaxID=1070528 RepID=A0A6C0I4M8_9ZZZZ